MNNQPKLAPHEALELHELMNTYLIGAKKINAELSIAQDEELKNFMQDCLTNKTTKLQEIEDFLNNSNNQEESQMQSEQQGQDNNQNQNNQQNTQS